MNEELLKKLIEYTEQASPVLWSAAQKQVEVNIFMASIWIWMWVFLAVFMLVLAGLCIYTRIKVDKDNFWVGATTFFFGIALLFSIICGGVYTDKVKYQMNPDYYTIKNLIELVPSK